MWFFSYTLVKQFKETKDTKTNTLLSEQKQNITFGLEDGTTNCKGACNGRNECLAYPSHPRAEQMGSQQQGL